MIKRVYTLLLSIFIFCGSLFGQQDVGISAILSPVSGCNVGSTTKPINVIVRNYSAMPVNPNLITVRYRINGGPITSQVITTFLLANASFNFTFSQTQNLSACSQWQVQVWTSYGGDPNNTNDTLASTFINDCAPIPGAFVGPSLLCQGSNSDSIRIVGGTFAYGLQWYSQVLPGPFNPTGITNDKIYLNNLANSTNFNVVYQGGLCPNVTSPTYTVNVSPPLNTGTTSPGTTSPNLVLCANNVAGNISLTGFVSNLNVWESSTNGGATWSSTGSNANPYSIAGVTTTTLFRALVSSGACGTGYSNNIEVTIEPLVNPGVISGGTTVCSGTNSGDLTLSGVANASFTQWYTSTDNITFTPTGNNTNTISYTNLTQTTYYKVIATGNSCPNAETAVTVVIVSPPISLGTNSPNFTVCSDNIVGTVSLSGFVASIVNWEQSINSGATWTNTGSNANPYNISGISGTTYFRAIVSSGACGTGTTTPIIVTLENSIVSGSISGAATVCQGSNAGSLTLSGQANQNSLQWYSSTDNVTYVPTGVTTATYNYLNLNQTTYFKVILQGNVCNPVETAVSIVTVSPSTNTGTPSGDLTFCSNNVIGSVSLSGFVSTILDWEQSINGGATWTSTGSNANPFSINGITTSTLYRAIVQSGVCPSQTSGNISVTIVPVITPGSLSGGTTVCASTNSGSLTLSGSANYSTFQWYSSTDNITFSPTGVSTFNFPYNNLTQTTYYKVVLSSATCPNGETAVTTIIVDPIANPGTPSANLTLCANNVVGNVSLSGFVSTISNWESSTNGGTTWTSVGSAANPLSINGITASTLYRAIVSSGTCPSIISPTISVAIEPEVIPGTISGATTVCSGSNSGVLNLSGNVNDFGFQWYSSTDNITFTATGITTAAFNYTNVTQTTYFKVILLGNACANAETPAVAVTVDPALNFGTPSADLFLCETNITGTVSLTGAVNLFDWEVSYDNGFNWVSTGTNTSIYDISALTASALFRGLISSGSCGSGYSDTIAVTIEPVVTPGIISGATPVCETSNSGLLTLVGNAYDFGYQWYESNDNITYTATGNSGPTLSFNNLTLDTYYKVILLGNICPNAQTPPVLVNVDPALNLGTTSADLVLCADNITGVVSLTGAVTLFDWEQSNDLGTTWFSTGDNNPSHNISALTASALFRGLVSSGACGSAYSDTISVTIEPLLVPGTVTGASTVCYGANSGALTLTGNANDFGLQWYSSTDNVTFTPTGITTNTYNYLNLTQTTYFRVVLQGNICSNATTNTVVITVDPALNLGTTSADLVLCADNISGVVSLTGAVTLIDWEQSNDNGITWFSTGDNNPIHNISTITASALFRGLVSSGACGSGYSATISVTIEQLIVPGTITGTNTVCAGANSGAITLAGNAYDFGIQWYSSTDNVTFTPTGITTNTYNYLNLTQTTYFRVVLQGNICSNATTNTVVITVDPALNLGTTSADLVLCADNISGVVSLTGAVTLIDWEQSNNGITWFSTGDNNPIHNISGLTTSAFFRGFVSSGVCGSGYSATISVIIEPAIIPGIASGTTSVCASANSGTLNLTGNANNVSFEWYSSTNNITFTPTGVFSNTYNYLNLTQTTYFKVLLQGNACADTQTNVVIVTVDSALNLGLASSDLILCADSVAGFVTLIGAVSLMDWEQSNDGGLTWISTGDNSASHNISTLTSSALFRGNISSGACGSGYSDTISVTIEAVILPGTASGTDTVCVDGNSGSLVLTGNANALGIEWYSSTDNVTFTPTGITVNTYNFLNLSQTTYFKVILQGNVCSDVESNVVVITVDSSLNLGVTSADLILCANNINGAVNLTGAVTLMDWEQSTNGGLTWTSTGDNNASHDISSITTTSLFRAYVNSGTCGSGYSDTISVTIQPVIIPGFILGDTTLCASSNVGSLNLTGNANDFGYEWYTSSDNSIFIATGITSPTYNYSNLTQTTYYRVVLEGNACSNAQTFTATVAVDPALDLGIVSPDLILCASNITGFVSLTGAVTLQDWQQSNNNGVSWFSLSNSSSSQSISSLTNSALFRAEISSGACGSGYSDTISVTIDAVGVPAVISNNFTICLGNGDSAAVSVNSHNGTILSWQTSVNNGTTWQTTGNSDSTYLISTLFQTTSYQLVTGHGACPNVVSNIVVGTVASPPIANAGFDQTVSTGSSFQLYGSGGLFGVWTPPTYLSNQNASSPLCTPLASIAYGYTVIDANGCTNTDYVVITVDSAITSNPTNDIQVYNIITTNGDGYNEFFIIEGLEQYDNNKLLIFDGNGTLLYSQEDYQSDWDGTYKGQLLPDGVYLYAIEVSKVVKHRGLLTIIKGK